MEIFQHKMDLKGCKWSSVYTTGTELHISHFGWQIVKNRGVILRHFHSHPRCIYTEAPSPTIVSTCDAICPNQKSLTTESVSEDVADVGVGVDELKMPAEERGHPD